MAAVARHFKSKGERDDLVKLFGGSPGATRFTEFQKKYETYADKEAAQLAEKSRKSKRGDRQETGPAFPGIRQQPAPAFPGVRMQFDEGGGNKRLSMQNMAPFDPNKEDGGGSPSRPTRAPSPPPPSSSTPLLPASKLPAPDPSSDNPTSAFLLKSQSVYASPSRGGQSQWSFSRSSNRDSPSLLSRGAGGSRGAIQMKEKEKESEGKKKGEGG
eukprot:CAMPEP_0201510418 /NCGR_PEP_ID=MMETSP0161_2-20130828/3116_1 /ASSEMBLY_ACC=CAM_ASM_000251 /TAXON_ID=180227 /ORGANISM="Neoparamoeba aestuarina, Strain SoJaBio B1-5/56/2" /LENGTH=213 /DNA_ID=CAMNT_0047905585 /DNA_START=1096 /DNA_END=1733 /DNA_ORIENTATION=-